MNFLCRKASYFQQKVALRKVEEIGSIIIINSMNQVSRNVETTTLPCEDGVHTFLLRPLTGSACLRESLKIDFSPMVDSAGVSSGILPEFNFDSSSSTPAFMLGVEKSSRYSLSSLFSEVAPARKVGITEEHLPIFQPKPAHNYCYACREVYLDYNKHLEHRVHKKNLVSSPFNNEIDGLILNFQRDIRRKEKKERSAVEGDQCLVENKPSKRRMQSRFLSRIENTLTRMPEAKRINPQASESTRCQFSDTTELKARKALAL